jgi:hypothetical protein
VSLIWPSICDADACGTWFAGFPIEAQFQPKQIQFASIDGYAVDHGSHFQRAACTCTCGRENVLRERCNGSEDYVSEVPKYAGAMFTLALIMLVVCTALGSLYLPAQALGVLTQLC